MERQTIEIRALPNGWYNFENIPQKHRDIKICNFLCETDRKALNRAKEINPNFNYKIKHQEN